MKQLFFYGMLCLVVLISTNNVMAQDNGWTAQKSKAWFQHGDWRKEVSVQPDPSINAQEFAVQFHKDEALWQKVLSFLSRNDLADLKPGKYPVAGDSAYATISEYTPHDLDEVKWESHRKYIDVQYVIRGKERIGVAAVATAKVTVPYDASKDVAHYETKGKFYTATPASFFIFFPQETHRPSIKPTPAPAPVKKLVIKVMEL